MSGTELSEAQLKARALVPIGPAILSIIASSVLGWLMWKARFRSPYRRLLFAMSVSDVLNSIRIVLGHFLIPSGSTKEYWAVGNDATCKFLGFMTQLTMPSYTYYSFLAAYFVLRIRLNMKDTYFARKIEPAVHVVCVGYAVATAVVGLALGLFGQSDFGSSCWINPQPEIGCDRTCALTLQWVMLGIPFAGTFLAVFVANATIVWHVFRTTRQSARWAATPPRGPTSRARRQTMVLTQSLLYVFVYYLTYVWTFAIRTMAMAGRTSKDESDLFPLFMVRSTFHPAMGIGNLFVYIRPRYLRSRARCPEKSRWATLKHVIMSDEKIDDFSSASIRRQTHSGGSKWGWIREHLSTLGTHGSHFFHSPSSDTNTIHFDEPVLMEDPMEGPVSVHQPELRQEHSLHDQDEENMHPSPQSITDSNAATSLSLSDGDMTLFALSPMVLPMAANDEDAFSTCSTETQHA